MAIQTQLTVRTTGSGKWAVYGDWYGAERKLSGDLDLFVAIAARRALLATQEESNESH
jgi:hypothetical protein